MKLLEKIISEYVSGYSLKSAGTTMTKRGGGNTEPNAGCGPHSGRYCSIRMEKIMENHEHNAFIRINIGTSPALEDSTPVVDSASECRARVECKAFIHQIERAYPPGCGGNVAYIQNTLSRWDMLEPSVWVSGEPSWCWRVRDDEENKLEYWDIPAAAEIAAGS